MYPTRLCHKQEATASHNNNKHRPEHPQAKAYKANAITTPNIQLLPRPVK
jgi:hypothetical protein